MTPIPKPKKRRATVAQQDIVFDEGLGLSTAKQQYDPTSIVNELRQYVDQWRELPQNQSKAGKNESPRGVWGSSDYGRYKLGVQ